MKCCWSPCTNPALFHVVGKPVCVTHLGEVVQAETVAQSDARKGSTLIPVGLLADRYPDDAA